MDFVQLTPEQQAVIEAPLNAKIFLEGPAGCGKTTAGVERLLHLMAQGVPGNQILLMVPQRTLAEAYYAALRTPGVSAGGEVTILTAGGLAQRMVALFWPLIAETAGFAHPELPPVFLTLETAQYYMAHVIGPVIQSTGLFESVVLDRNRLYSQILDNLNKSAVVGFPYTQIGERLQAAWIGDSVQKRIFADAQLCASRFREYCLEHNLLDFSLQVEVFSRHLWTLPVCRQHLRATFRHLLVDNLEEDTPFAHDLLRDWLPETETALLIYDEQAGFRRFLGANPRGAYQLKAACQVHHRLASPFVASPHVTQLNQYLSAALDPSQPLPPTPPAGGTPLLPVSVGDHRFYPEMLEWTASQVYQLVHDQGVPPNEIVILAPFVSDALRYALSSRLENKGLSLRSHRPSRSLREEPVTQCLLNLAVLAHPDWELFLTRFDLAYTWMQSIAGLDLVRAQLLAEKTFPVTDKTPPLRPFDEVSAIFRQRITYLVGERYERLRLWLADYTQGQPVELDIFISRLFGELLSQPEFGYHADFNAGEIAANLIESIQKFRWVAEAARGEITHPLGKEYLLMLKDGVLAAQYIRSWQTHAEEAALLTPAYTFLMSNHPVDYQFWLDIGSRGWFERLYQPLTHPYVLSRDWSEGKPWTDADEYKTAQDSLQCLVTGLLRRCRQGVYLAFSDLGEQGYEQRGPLLVGLQRLLFHQRVTLKEEPGTNV